MQHTCTRESNKHFLLHTHTDRSLTSIEGMLYITFYVFGGFYLPSLTWRSNIFDINRVYVMLFCRFRKNYIVKWSNLGCEKCWNLRSVYGLWRRLLCNIRLFLCNKNVFLARIFRFWCCFLCLFWVQQQ